MHSLALLTTTMLFIGYAWCAPQEAANNRAGALPSERNKTVYDIYLNLHLYYDKSMLDYFKKDRDATENFILSNTYSAALSYNNPPMSDFAKFHFVIHTLEQVDDQVQLPPNRDGNSYRVALNKHYHNNKIASFALVLFTYVNWLYRSNKTETQGLANTGSGCVEGRDRAVIVQARSYRTAFVLAHELGHSLGLSHDEDVGCDGTYIMSKSTGTGKNQFSRCSFNWLKKEFTKLFLESKDTAADKKKADCYRSPPSPDDKLVGHYPDKLDLSYRSVPLSQQCQMGLGDVFTFQESTLSSNICSRVACTNGLIQIYTNPALENTTCGGGKYCRAGNCR